MLISSHIKVYVHRTELTSMKDHLFFEQSIQALNCHITSPAEDN